MKQAKWYVLSGVVAFLIALVVHWPASIAWRYGQPYLQLPPGVQVSGVRGSVWNGEALIGYRTLYQGRLRWRGNPFNLLLQRRVLSAQLEGSGHQLEGTLSLSWSGLLQATLRGRLEPEFINPLLTAYHSTMSGSVAINDLRLVLSREGVQAADGAIAWQGGPTSYRMGQQRYDIEYPPLLGQLKAHAGGVLLDVAEARGRPPIVSAGVAQNGWAELKVMRRITQVVRDLPLRRPASSTGVLLSVKEKVF